MRALHVATAESVAVSPAAVTTGAIASVLMGTAGAATSPTLVTVAVGSSEMVGSARSEAGRPKMSTRNATRSDADGVGLGCAGLRIP